MSKVFYLQKNHIHKYKFIIIRNDHFRNPKKLNKILNFYLNNHSNNVVKILSAAKMLSFYSKYAINLQYNYSINAVKMPKWFRFIIVDLLHFHRYFAAKMRWKNWPKLLKLHRKCAALFRTLTHFCGKSAVFSRHLKTREGIIHLSQWRTCISLLIIFNDGE